MQGDAEVRKKLVVLLLVFELMKKLTNFFFDRDSVWPNNGMVLNKLYVKSS